MSKINLKETTATTDKNEAEIEKPVSSSAVKPFEEIDRMFDDFFSRGWLRPFRFNQPSWSHLPTPFEGRTPHMDVIDRDDEIFVKAELPGVEKNDIEISMTSHSVTIKGSTKKEEKEEKGNYHRFEISQGSFLRTESLPSEVDVDKASAKFNHGVLKITLPKVKKSNHKSVKVE